MNRSTKLIMCLGAVYLFVGVPAFLGVLHAQDGQNWDQEPSFSAKAVFIEEVCYPKITLEIEPQSGRLAIAKTTYQTKFGVCGVCERYVTTYMLIPPQEHELVCEEPPNLDPKS